MRRGGKGGALDQLYCEGPLAGASVAYALSLSYARRMR